MNSIATAIYLGVSITDHSCQPNAVATFEGNELHVHAIEDLPCLDWSKIYISYIDLLNTPEQRRADLKEHYYFLCVCSKCIDPQEMHEMTAAVCPNGSCDASVNIQLDKCESCGTPVSEQLRTDYNEVMSLTQSSLDSMKEVACKWTKWPDYVLYYIYSVPFQIWTSAKYAWPSIVASCIP